MYIQRTTNLSGAASPQRLHRSGRRLSPKQAAGRFFSDPDRQKFLTMLALIAYACFWAYLGALFVEYVSAPLEIEREVLAFEQIVGPDVACGEAPDFYDCVALRGVE